MRALVGLLVLCLALPAAASEPKDLRGCWIERTATATTTWRWKPEKHGIWRADTLTYFNAGGDPDPGRWRLKPGDETAPYLFCMVELNMMSGPPCSRAYLGPGKATEDDAYWVELVLDEDREGFTITYKYDGGEQSEFAHPRRDGCD